LVAAIALGHDLLTALTVVVVQTGSISVLAAATTRQTVHAATLVLVVLVSPILLLSLLVLHAALDLLVSSAASCVLLETLVPELLLDAAYAVCLLVVVATLEASLKYKSEVCTL